MGGGGIKGPQLPKAPKTALSHLDPWIGMLVSARLFCLRMRVLYIYVLYVFACRNNICFVIQNEI